MSLIRKLVYKNLKLNKKRTIVMVVGIILSVALLSALSTLVMSFRGSLIAYEKKKNGNFHIAFFQIGREQVEQVKKNIYVDELFVTEELGYALIEGCKNEDKPYAYVIATDKAGFSNLSFNLVEGRMAEKDNEIVIPRHLKTNGRVEYRIGDTITLEVGERKFVMDGYSSSQYTDFQGGEQEKLANTQTKTYTVVGIMERPGYQVEPYTAPGYTFVTYNDFSKDNSGNLTAYVHFNSKVVGESYIQMANIIGVNAESFEKLYADYAHIEDFSEELTTQFPEEMEKSPFKNFNINYYLIQYERLWPMDGTFLVVFTIGCFVAVLIIFTSVYCIKNSFEISVSEKIRQYGMLSGIGATKNQIRRCVFTEAGIMGAIGIPLGLASGLLASFILIKVSNQLLYDSLSLKLIYCVSALAIIASTILGILTVYLSALSGAWKAARVSPIEAIRNQKEIKLNSKKLKTPGFVSKLFGVGGVVAFKNIKRNRKKYRTTVVSIAICTVSFLIISYFMSMGFSLVGINVAENDCNISVSIGKTPDQETLMRDFANLDTVERFSAISSRAIDIGTKYLTKEFVDKCLSGTSSDHYAVNTYVLDDASFMDYAKECGISDAEGKAIIIKNFLFIDIGDITAFDLEKGDILEFSRNDYSNVEVDWGTGEIISGEAVVRTSQLEVAGSTTVRPFGKQTANTEAIVISVSTAANVEFADLGRTSMLLCFKSNNTDALQDNLEIILDEKVDVYGTGASINNLEASNRQTHSLLVLLAIFAYGLITVMALIGVTNTVNTLNTSMELRARDFATLRSIGMTGNQFEKMVVLETVFTTIKALFWGILLGMLGSYAIWRYETEVELMLPFNPPVKAALGCSVSVFALVYIIIRFSLARINKRNIIDTIKNENL